MKNNDLAKMRDERLKDAIIKIRNSKRPTRTLTKVHDDILVSYALGWMCYNTTFTKESYRLMSKVRTRKHPQGYEYMCFTNEQAEEFIRLLVKYLKKAEYLKFK